MEEAMDLGDADQSSQEYGYISPVYGSLVKSTNQHK